MTEKINVKDFSMAEFLKWLSDNKSDIDILKMEVVGELMVADVGMNLKK